MHQMRLCCGKNTPPPGTTENEFYPGQFCYANLESETTGDVTGKTYQASRLKAAGSMDISFIGDVLRWTHLQRTGTVTADASELVRKYGGTAAAELFGAKRARTVIDTNEVYLSKRLKTSTPKTSGPDDSQNPGSPPAAILEPLASKTPNQPPEEESQQTKLDAESKIGTPESICMIPTVEQLTKNYSGLTKNKGNTDEPDLKLRESTERSENRPTSRDLLLNTEIAESDDESMGNLEVNQAEAEPSISGEHQWAEPDSPEKTEPRVELRSPGSAAASRSTKPSTTPTLEPTTHEASEKLRDTITRNWILPEDISVGTVTTRRYQFCATHKMRVRDNSQGTEWNAEPAELDLGGVLNTVARELAIGWVEGSPRIMNGTNRRLQKTRNQDLLSKITPGTLAWTAIRSIRELEEVEYEVQNNGLRALIFPVNNALNDHLKLDRLDENVKEPNRVAKRKQILSDCMMNAVASQARPFWLDTGLFDELKTLREDRARAEASTATVNLKDHRPACPINVKPTTLTEQWVTTEQKQSPQSVGRFIACVGTQSCGYSISVDGSYFPKDLILQQVMKISKRPANSAQEHHSYAAPKTRKGFTTTEDIEQRQLDQPGHSHLIFIAPHDDSWEKSSEARYKIQHREGKNYRRKVQQCELAHLHREIDLGDQLLSELNEFRGELAKTSFYQGTMDEWRTVIEQATPEGTSQTYTASAHAFISGPSTGVHDFYKRNTYVLRISPFNRIDILTADSAGVTMSPMLIGGFDKICREKEKEHMEEILGPVQEEFVTAECPDWLGPKVKSACPTERTRTEVTIPMALRVDEGIHGKPVMNSLEPSQLPGWTTHPRSISGNEANLLRLQLSILERTVNNLSVQFDSASPHCFENLRLGSQQAAQAAARTLGRLDQLEAQHGALLDKDADLPTIWVPARGGPIDEDSTTDDHGRKDAN